MHTETMETAVSNESERSNGRPSLGLVLCALMQPQFGIVFEEGKIIGFRFFAPAKITALNQF